MEGIEEYKDFSNILFPVSEDSAGTQDVKTLDMEQLAYLSLLGSQGLDSLNGEVARLNEELAIVEHQTRDMASQNYQIFVQSAQTTNLIKKSLDVGIEAVVRLTGKTFPELKTSVDHFCGSPCNDFKSSQQGIGSMFEKETKLGLVLDMPWIVRRCLAEERLPDAIKILQAAQDLQKNNQSGLLTLSRTCAEVMELKSEIQHALLLKLSSGSIGLSDCLQTVSLLRSFFPDDKSLRFRFLQSRMKDVPFDLARAWVFDTLTQHRAAFGGDSNHYLATFVALQMTRTMTELSRHVDQGESMDSLLTSALYLVGSLARVGSDLRGVVVPMFSEQLVKRVNHDLTQSEIQFGRNLHVFNLSAVANMSHGDMSSNLEQQSSTSSTDNDSLTPPSQLINHPPLASYLNEVLTVLNTVGKCPLPQCVTPIVDRLNASVQKVGDELETWGGAEWLTWEQREQTLFNCMKRDYEQLLVPHIDKVFRVIFPPGNISSLTGLGIAKCAEFIHIRYSNRT